MRYARYGSDDAVEQPMVLLRRAAHYGRHLKMAALGAIVAAVVATGLRLAGPLVVQGGVDDGVIAGDRGEVTSAALLYLVLLIGQYASNGLALRSVNSVGERFLRRLRVGVYEHLMRLDLTYFGRTKAGVIVSRMTSDVEALTTFSNEGAINIITSTLTIVGVLVGMFIADSTLALVVLAVMPVLIGASVVFRIHADRAYRAVREQIGLVLSSLQEGISGVRVVQAYVQERSQAHRFHRVNKKFYEANLRAARAISTYFPVVDFLRTFSVVLVLFVGGRRVIAGDMTFGALLAFLLYLNWFFEPIVQLSNVYNLLQSALAALSKLFGVLDEKPDVVEHPEAVGLATPVQGRLTFEDIRFGYDPTIPIIDGLDLEVPAGQRVAIVGETGAGKSTLTKLGARFYDPQRGQVSIDGVPLTDVSFEALRDAVAVVPQEGFLFEGTIRENILYAAPDLTDDELRLLCRTLGIEDWIDALPEGFDTQVRERGGRLSSGERQLVALARAMAADPAVIMLDEATSNLDPQTEARVEQALSTLLAGRTALVVAHRLQTAERADRVIVIDDGAIVEDGPFDELIQGDGHFARLRAIWETAEAN